MSQNCNGRVHSNVLGTKISQYDKNSKLINVHNNFPK